MRVENTTIFVKGGRYKIEYEIPGEPPKRTQIVTYLGKGFHRFGMHFSAEGPTTPALFFDLAPLGGELKVSPNWITKVDTIS